MSEKHQPFLWASGTGAKKEEPIESLRQNGWRAGDVPAASNFNWLFHNIQKEMYDLKNQISEVKNQLETIKTDFMVAEAKINAELLTQKENAVTTNDIARKALARSLCNKRGIRFCEGISRQICEQLRFMEKNISAFVPGFPTNHMWPLK